MDGREGASGRALTGHVDALTQTRRSIKLPLWTASLMARRPRKVAGVALAKKIARAIWVHLVKGGIYRAPAIMAKASGKVPKPDKLRDDALMPIRSSEALRLRAREIE